MDNQSGCCEEARTRIVDWFEKHIQNNEFKNKTGLLVGQNRYSELPCEELYSEFEEMVLAAEEVKASGVTAVKPYDDVKTLRDILNDWDDCRKEPESVEVKEQNPAMDNFPLFQENPASWMNAFIRGRN